MYKRGLLMQTIFPCCTIILLEENMIDIVIPTLNRKEELTRCVESIPEKPYYRINILVETKEEEAMYQELFGNRVEVKLIEFTTIFECWNDFVMNTTTDVVLFLADDCVLLPECLSEAEKCLREKSVVGLNVINYPDNWALIRENGSRMMYEFFLVDTWFFKKYFQDKKPFCPDYFQFWAEQEFCMFAESKDEFHFCTSAKIQHWHPDIHGEYALEIQLKRDKNKVIDDITRELRNIDGLFWGENFGLIGETE